MTRRQLRGYSIFAASWLALSLIERATPGWPWPTSSNAFIALLVAALVTPGGPRRVRFGSLLLISSLVVLSGMGGLAEGWPWPENKPATALVAVIIAALFTSIHLGLALALSGAGSPGEEPTRS